MVLSTPGGDNQDQALSSAAQYHRVWHDPQEAVEAARFDTQHYVSRSATRSVHRCAIEHL